MKMPETIRVGVCDADIDNMDPRQVAGLSSKVWLSIDDAHGIDDTSGEGFFGEYRFVRLVEVTQTTPAPIIEVKEVQ